MIKLTELLQKELTRKQFVMSLFSAVVGMLGISTFLGAFTKGIDQPKTTRPGYGEHDYGP